MSQSIAKLALVVRDYDEAIAWFSRCLGFELVEDIDMGGGKRWVVVRPPGEPSAVQGAALLLARAVGPAQEAAIGNQSGGRVFLFLETDDFARDHARMIREGVRFMEAPRRESYGTVAVFEDLCGNRWDLIQHAPNPSPAARK
jgi:catechol 2,3-dioxygenase-like lactoylglutathione lyase family enzyme